MDSVFKVQKCLSSDPVESKVQAAVQQSNLTFPAPVVDSGRGCGMQDNQLSIVEKIQSLWSANSSEILIIISTVGLDNMVIRVTEYHPSGFTKIYFYSLSHISLTGSPQSTRPPEYISIKNYQHSACRRSNPR